MTVVDKSEMRKREKKTESPFKHEAAGRKKKRSKKQNNRILFNVPNNEAK